MTKRIVTYNGVSHTLKEWSAICGISAHTLSARLYCKWPVEKAISTPLQHQGINIPRKKAVNKAGHDRLKARRLAAGLCCRCKSPLAEGNKRFCEEHRRSQNYLAKIRRDANPEKYKEWSIRYSNAHRKENVDKAKAYYRANKEKVQAYKRSIRHIENERKKTPEYKEKRNARRRSERLTNPQKCMADRIRKRIGRAIRDYAPGMKLRRTQEYIGCTMDEFMAHVERQFLEGMGWHNREKWHLDHRIPCKSFDLTDPEQQKACFHFSNLQPLWAADNIRKHARINYAIQEPETTCLDVCE